MKLFKIIIPALIILITSCEPKYNQTFISTDVDNFWTAYDKIITTKDTVLQEQYLNEYFLDKKTEGQEAIMQVRRYSAKEYLDAIEKYPKFWNSIRGNTEESAIHYHEIEKNIGKLKNLYPELKPSTIYFLMGIFRTNGTILDQKVLIGCEMALSSKNVDISELPDHPKDFNTLHNPIDDISFLCTHEFVHTQQKELADNLLSYCIYEGIPEFIATLVTGKESYASAIGYAESNYEAVRNKFEEDLYIPSRTYDWLWSSNQIFGQRDLGYGVGFGMAKRYYENAPDKEKAIKEMIELDFFNEAEVEYFVDASNYLTQPISVLFNVFDKSRPTIIKVTGIENGSKTIKAGTQEITVHFSEPLNGINTSVDLGEAGKEAFPELSLDRIWSKDNQSWTITAELESKKHYQILISNNFRTVNDIPLKPYLIEFWTE